MAELIAQAFYYGDTLINISSLIKICHRMVEEHTFYAGKIYGHIAQLLCILIDKHAWMKGATEAEIMDNRCHSKCSFSYLIADTLGYMYQKFMKLIYSNLLDV